MAKARRWGLGRALPPWAPRLQGGWWEGPSRALVPSLPPARQQGRPACRPTILGSFYFKVPGCLCWTGGSPQGGEGGYDPLTPLRSPGWGLELSRPAAWGSEWSHTSLTPLGVRRGGGPPFPSPPPRRSLLVAAAPGPEDLLCAWLRADPAVGTPLTRPS